MRRLLFTFCIVLCFFVSGYAFANSDLKGKASDKSTGDPIQGVTIKIEGTALGTVSRTGGEFHILNIKPGKYNVLATMLGYQTAKLPLTISNDKPAILNIILEPEPLQTEEVVVSANKRLQAVQDVPISVSIIDNKTLQQRNLSKIDQALRTVPGINLSGDQVSIRGSSGFAYGVGSRVAFLIDGFPMLAGDQGDIKFDQVPIFNIDRIEVVKGAGSALYGSSALGGVINVITAPPDESPRLRARLSGGIYTKPKYSEWDYRSSLSTQRGIDIGYSCKIADVGILLSGGLKKDDSYKLFDDGFRSNLFSKISWAAQGKFEADIMASYAHDDHADWVYWRSVKYATLPPEDVNLSNRFISDKISLAGSFKYIFGTNDFAVLKSSLYKTNFTNNKALDSDSLRSSDTWSYNNELQFNNKIFNSAFLTSGVNYVYNIVESNLFGNKIQNIASVYSQVEIPYAEIITLTAGLRLDREQIESEKVNLEASPKLGCSYTTPFGSKLRFSLGRGFRAPMIGEKFATLKYSSFNVVPNLDLAPEISFSYEAGINHELTIDKTELHFDFAFFNTDYDRLIEAQFVTVNGASNIQFRNVTKARITGIEFNTKAILFSRFGIESSVTLMKPMDLTLNEPLKFRPNVLFYNRLIVPFSFFEFQAEYKFINRIEKIDDNLRLGIIDYDVRIPIHLVDARILLHMNKITGWPIDISINANNLFDYYYTEYPGNLAPTRLLSLQIDSSF